MLIGFLPKRALELMRSQCAEVVFFVVFCVFLQQLQSSRYFDDFCQIITLIACFTFIGCGRLRMYVRACMLACVRTYMHTCIHAHLRMYSMARNNRNGLALGSSRLLHSFAFGAGGVQKGLLGAPSRLLGAPLRLLGAPLRLLGSLSRAHKKTLFRLPFI